VLEGDGERSTGRVIVLDRRFQFSFRRLRPIFHFTDGFSAAIGACAGLSLAGALAGLGIPARRQAAESTATSV
jgi:hypothetical protein